jgi:GT2 family glycosyltransferase
MEKVSIVLPIVTPFLELKELTLDFIACLQETTDASDYELIVVESESWCMPSGADLYIHEPKVTGFGHAVNLGIKVASHDWIAIIGNDVALPKGWLPKMLAAWHPQYGTLHPADTAHGIPPGTIEEGECFWPLAFTHKKVLKEVGLLDESLSYRFHDQDISIRMMQHGYRVVRTGDVFVGHLNNATYYTFPEEKRAAWESKESTIMLKRYGCTMYHQWYDREIRR